MSEKFRIDRDITRLVHFMFYPATQFLNWNAKENLYNDICTFFRKNNFSTREIFFISLFSEYQAGDNGNGAHSFPK
jgi:hypothetical protein